MFIDTYLGSATNPVTYPTLRLSGAKGAVTGLFVIFSGKSCGKTINDGFYLPPERLVLNPEQLDHGVISSSSLVLLNWERGGSVADAATRESIGQ